MYGRSSAVMESRGYAADLEPIFKSSELAKNVPNVVKAALQSPVVISTPHGAVSMLARDCLRALVRRANLVESLLRASAARYSDLPAVAYPPTLRWVRGMTRDQCASMVGELLALLDESDIGRGDIDGVEDCLHEWAQSAAAAFTLGEA